MLCKQHGRKMGDKTSLITLQMFVCDIEDNIDKKSKNFKQILSFDKRL